MKTHTTKYTVIQDNAESRNRLIKNFKNQWLMNTVFLLLQFLFLNANVDPRKSLQIIFSWDDPSGIYFSPLLLPGASFCLLVLRRFTESPFHLCVFRILHVKWFLVIWLSKEILLNSSWISISPTRSSPSPTLLEKSLTEQFFCVIHVYRDWLFYEKRKCICPKSQLGSASTVTMDQTTRK
jgi:hypothetical protein